MTGYLVAPDAVAEMPPLDRACAEKWLDDMVMCLKSGLNHPLPVTAKTALAFLSVMNSDDSKIDSAAKLNKAMAAARKVYEGDGYNSVGELGYSRYLMRTYPDFNTIRQAGSHPFQELAESLYSPLLQTVRIINFTE